MGLIKKIDIKTRKGQLSGNFFSVIEIKIFYIMRIIDIHWMEKQGRFFLKENLLFCWFLFCRRIVPLESDIWELQTMTDKRGEDYYNSEQM